MYIVYVFLFIIVADAAHKNTNYADVYLFFKPLYGEFVCGLFHLSFSFFLSLSLIHALCRCLSLSLYVCLHLIKFCRFLSVIVIIVFFLPTLNFSLPFSFSLSTAYLRLSVARLL